MRDKLIKILRQLENESGFKTEYVEFLQDYICNYFIEEYFDFPNYRFLIKRFNDQYSTRSESGLILLTSENAIRAELKRMELDDLVTIGVQKGIRQARPDGAAFSGPDYENVIVNSESIILTTKGKSKWQYFLYTAVSNPFNVIAIIISILALIISIFK